MPYTISSRFLSVPWFERLVAETLDMYLRGEDLADSPLTRVGRVLAWRNRWHWTLFNCTSKETLEKGLREREKTLIELYHSIQEKGYDGSIIAVWFDDDGQIHLYDGYHRLTIMKYLGIEVEVNVETVWWSKDFDFPLRSVLEKLPRVGQCTYEPVDDERVKDFPTDRQDSPARLKYFLRNLAGKTVLDIGCSEGYFARELAKRGYEVTAIDSDRGKVAVTRYLSTINNLEVHCELGVGEEFLKKSPGFDNVLYLSVFHNNIWNTGTARAFLLLRHFKGKAKRLFLEVPDGPREQQWVQKSAGAPLYHFKGRKFELALEEATGMRLADRYHGFRPIYQLVLDPGHLVTPARVNWKEWRRHNEWESNWWDNCQNTYGEQLLQEMYIRWMKLDQFASKKKPYTFDLGGRSIVDIGGGPVSILLRCENFSRAIVVDPCKFPNWIHERYQLAGIEFVNQPGEKVTLNGKFDEAWIYNCLQHVQDPVRVIKKAISLARKIRVFEPLEVGIYPGHPHNLTKEDLDEAFGKEGLVLDRGGKPGDVYYMGVFSYD